MNRENQVKTFIDINNLMLFNNHGQLKKLHIGKVAKKNVQKTV